MNKLPLTCRTTCSIALLVAAFSSASAQDRRSAGLDKNHDVTHEHFDQHAAATLFKRKCQSCHTVPDTRHELDGAWLDQIKRTAWTATPPGARRALIEYLKSETPRRPLTVVSDTIVSESSESSTNGKNTGYVTADVGEGELFLRGPHHRVYRLKWNRDEQNRRRALPVGRYSITGYRVVRKDEKGVPWFVSTTSHGFRRIVVRSGEVKRIKIDPAVHVGVKATIHGEQLRAQMMIHGDRPGGGGLMAGRHAGHHAPHRIGLSIYRAGKRISIGYRALDRQGEVIASGTMQYG